LVTGPFDYPVRLPWAPGALLVGDAAGYYDPFTGQGIRQALRTARLAAEAILSVLEHGEKERRAFARYGRRVKRQLVPTRWVQQVIEAVISRPRLMSRFIDGLSEPGPATRLLRVTGDLAHPVTLADPVLWTRFLYRLGYPRG
jgi:flavin-dependent dehydrogenase